MCLFIVLLKYSELKIDSSGAVCRGEIELDPIFEHEVQPELNFNSHFPSPFNRLMTDDTD